VRVAFAGVDKIRQNGKGPSENLAHKPLDFKRLCRNWTLIQTFFAIHCVKPPPDNAGTASMRAEFPITFLGRNEFVVLG
jgi:hypothetical protein